MFIRKEQLTDILLKLCAAGKDNADHYIFCSLPLVPDRQYEVKVWAFSKQTEGAAAVWKGRTDKPHDRRENQCLSAEKVFEKKRNK